MLKEIHFLLTYACLYECDHCFLYCGPEAEGTFTITQIQEALDQIAKVKSIDKVYFEGGEAFIYYPLLLESVRQARAQGLDVGIVTNSYWATSVADAELWLKPLVEIGISDISMSDDTFHFNEEQNLAKFALKAARNLGMSADAICIDEPTITPNPTSPGESVVGGGVIFRGRAVEKLSADLPTRPINELTSCPYEDLENPTRLHLDPFGNLHLCQGLVMGNIRQTPLAQILREYSAKDHPVCKELVSGGPLQLARKTGFVTDSKYIEECHFCYDIRRHLLDRYPDFLTPKLVYGL